MILKNIKIIFEDGDCEETIITLDLPQMHMHTFDVDQNFGIVEYFKGHSKIVKHTGKHFYKILVFPKDIEHIAAKMTDKDIIDYINKL